VEYLSYVFLATLVAILLALGLCALLWELYFNPTVGLWLVLGTFLCETAVIEMPVLHMGIEVYVQDLVFIAIGFAAALRFLGGGRMARLPWPLWIMGAVMLFSFVLGLATFGATAGVEFREDFYFWVGTAYFLSFVVADQQLASFARAWVVTALLIMLIVYYRWLADALSLNWIEPIWHYDMDTQGSGLRVVNAGQALFLGQALILLVYAMATGSGLRYWRFLIPFLIATILVLQHRSAWGAAFIPVLLSILLVKKGRDRLVVGLTPVLLVSAAILVPILMGGDDNKLISSIENSAKNATNLSEGTTGDRVEGWKELLAQWAHAGPVVNTVGSPYGSGYARELQHRLIIYAPHNYYIHTLLRTGLTGLAALLVLYWYVLHWLRRDLAFSHADVPAAAMVALLLSQLLYYIPYQVGYAQGIILGIALSLVRDRMAGWQPPYFVDAKIRGASLCR
jgi:hypothetical protein